MHTNNDMIAPPSVTSYSSSIDHHTVKSSLENKQELETLYETLGGMDTDDPQIAEALHQTGIASLNEGNHPEAKRYFIEALTMYRALEEDDTVSHEEINYSAIKAEILKNLGIVYLAQLELAQAYSSFTQALTLVKGIPSQSLNIAELEYYLGLTLLAQSQAGEAATYLNRALSIFQSLLDSNHPNIAETYYHLGLADHQQKKFISAQAYFTQALAMWYNLLGDNAHHLKIAATLYNLGLVFQAQSQNAQAILYFTQAISQYKTIYSKSTQIELGNVYLHLGETHLAEKHFDLAKSNLEKALTIYQAIFMDNAEHELIITTKKGLNKLSSSANKEAGEHTSLMQSVKTNYESFNITSHNQQNASAPQTTQSTWWCCLWCDEDNQDNDTSSTVANNHITNDAMHR